MTNKRPQPGHEIGMIGLGVIGCNLLLNMDAHHAAIRAVAGAGFAMAVTAVIGRLLGLVAVG